MKYKKIIDQTHTNCKDLNEIIKSAVPLTALQLNNFKLDVKHTVLTPAYLDNISSST